MFGTHFVFSSYELLITFDYQRSRHSLYGPFLTRPLHPYDLDLIFLGNLKLDLTDRMSPFVVPYFLLGAGIDRWRRLRYSEWECIFDRGTDLVYCVGFGMEFAFSKRKSVSLFAQVRSLALTGAEPGLFPIVTIGVRVNDW